jgi:hypothetical protein
LWRSIRIFFKFYFSKMSQPKERIVKMLSEVLQFLSNRWL